jgi:hypothetical protein
VGWREGYSDPHSAFVHGLWPKAAHWQLRRYDTIRLRTGCEFVAVPLAQQLMGIDARSRLGKFASGLLKETFGLINHVWPVNGFNPRQLFRGVIVAIVNHL